MLPTNRTLQLLLNTADLEFRLKKMFHNLLDTKEQRWEVCICEAHSIPVTTPTTLHCNHHNVVALVGCLTGHQEQGFRHDEAAVCGV